MMVKEAFEKWLASLNVRPGPDTSLYQDYAKAFEAGWSAARAEARSDAADPTGGRVPSDTNKPG